jgi:AcrR family transcriptional regulator
MMSRRSPLKPRKTPRQQRSTETVNVILEAAARILERRGLDGFTTNAVAERAGVSIGSLYQYFPSKEALTATLIGRETTTLVENAAAALDEASGRAALLKLIAAAVRHQLRRPVLARLLDFEEASLPLGKETRNVTDKLSAIVAEILRRPDLPPQPDFGVASADVIALAKGLIDSAGQRGEMDSKYLEDRVRRALFGYLAAA